MRKDLDIIIGFIAVFFAVVTFMFFRNDPFYGDAVIGVSRGALKMYQQPWNQPFFESYFDPGHPTLWPWLLAISWSVFGIKSWVAHAWMSLIAGAFIWIFGKTISSFFSKEKVILTLILFCFTPMFWSYTGNPHQVLWLLLGNVLLLNGFINRNLFIQFLGVFLLILSHLTGVFLLIGFCVFLMVHKKSIWLSFRELLPIYFGLLLFGSWGYFHFQQTGWWYSAPSYSLHREGVTLFSAGKNFMIGVSRFFDFGLLAFWIPVIYFLLFKKRSFRLSQIGKWEVTPVVKFGLLQVLVLLSLLVMTLNFHPGHRYFFPCIPFLIAGSVSLVNDRKILMFSLVGIILLSGFYWVSDARCLGDANLKYRNYFLLIPEMNSKLNTGEIPYSFAPLSHLPKETHPWNRDSKEVKYLGDINLSEASTILTGSCVCESKTLEKDLKGKQWSEDRLERGGVYLSIWRKP
jgi:hypothetical protein